MTRTDGASWVSNIYCSQLGLFTYSERQNPPHPFAAMQYIRTFRSLDNARTEVTEKVNFEFCLSDPQNETVTARRIEAHMADLHPKIKAHMEQCAVRQA
jgi:hypothetical protein